jgi:peptidoglycan-N-acetylglucosamine deacetylase
MKILTFDIEDWFHILDNPSTSSPENWENFSSRLEESLDMILEILENSNQKATFFILGWVAMKYPKLVKKISDLGYSIGSHSYAHQLAYEQTFSEFSIDLEKSIKVLQDVTGKEVLAYRAPGFSIKQSNLWVFEMLIKNGIKLDSSIFPAPRGHGGLLSFPYQTPTLIQSSIGEITEFPLNYNTLFGKKIVFSGGGYFRFFPKMVLKKWFRESDYLMTYFHPRDFDKDQPMIKDLSMARKFKSYYGLNSTQNKLREILKENNFVDLFDAQKFLKENKVALPVFKI